MFLFHFTQDAEFEADEYLLQLEDKEKTKQGENAKLSAFEW